MKIKQSIPRNIERLQVANHVFFITALAFVAHQNVLHPATPRVEVPIVAQALNLQPRTPPPAFDPDSVSVEEVDLSGAP